MNKLLVFALFLLPTTGFSQVNEIYEREFATQIFPFTTDGCSEFMDGPTTGKHYEWLHCCEQHDIKYWSGLGGAAGHDKADMELRQCIKDAGFPGYALLMYRGVRAAKAVNTYTNVSFRWGYGWPFILGHNNLNQPQLESVKQMTATITTGITNYRNQKGYPVPTQKQWQAVYEIIDGILKTPNVETQEETLFYNAVSEQD